MDEASLANLVEFAVKTAEEAGRRTLKYSFPLIGVMHQPYVGETFVGSRLGAQLRTRAGIRNLRSGAFIAS